MGAYSTRLVAITTDDGVTLDGALYVPDETPKQLALLLSHGTNSNWYSGVPGWLGPLMAERGFTSLALNRRDHDESFANSIFEDGLKDLKACFDYLAGLGHAGAHLVGHSLGSVFVTYYAAVSGDARVKSVGLYGGIHHLPELMRDTVLKGKYDDFLALARAMVAEGKGEDLMLMSWLPGRTLITTPRTFLSYRGPDANTTPTKWIQQVWVPVLLLRSTTDQLHSYTDQGDLDLEAAARGKVPVFEHVRLEDPVKDRDPSEGHSFRGQEEKAADATVRFLEAHVPEANTTLSQAQRLPALPYTEQVVGLPVNARESVQACLRLPRSAPRKVLAVLATHGTGGRFYHGVPDWLARGLAEAGHATLAANRRDHDGQGINHIFEDGVADLKTALDHLESLGFDQVFLAGHSVGTLFVAYYAATTKDPRVKAIGLYGTLYDLPRQLRETTFRDQYEEYLGSARELVAAGRGAELMLIRSPGRPGTVRSAQNVVNYWAPEANTVGVKWIAQVAVPVFIVHDAGDQMAPEGNSLAMLEAARAGSAPQADYRQLPAVAGVDPAGAHRFAGNEAPGVKATLEWLASLGD